MATRPRTTASSTSPTTSPVGVAPTPVGVPLEVTAESACHHKQFEPERNHEQQRAHHVTGPGPQLTESPPATGRPVQGRDSERTAGCLGPLARLRRALRASTAKTTAKTANPTPAPGTPATVTKPGNRPPLPKRCVRMLPTATYAAPPRTQQFPAARHPKKTLRVTHSRKVRPGRTADAPSARDPTLATLKHPPQPTPWPHP